jgi:para-nitrobenzyl esterase
MATPGAPALFQRAIIQSAPLGIARGRGKMNTAMGVAAETVSEETPALDVVAIEDTVAQAARKFGLMAAMPFGTQYGHAPLPEEARIDAAWNAVAPDIEVLIGHTADEARLFLPGSPLVSRLAKIPVLGRAAIKAINWAVTEAVYGRSARKFARRHARAGGRTYRYVLTWGAPGNFYGAAHTVDLPLLFGDQQTWEGAGLLAGASWAEVNAQGRAVRAVWARFASGRGLDSQAGIPGALRYRAV